MSSVVAFFKRRAVRLALAALLTAGGTAAATGNLDVGALVAAVLSAFAPVAVPNDPDAGAAGSAP